MKTRSRSSSSAANSKSKTRKVKQTPAVRPTMLDPDDPLHKAIAEMTVEQRLALANALRPVKKEAPQDAPASARTPAAR